MRKCLLVLLSVYFFGTVEAQTITQAFNEPSVGEVDINYKLDTSTFVTGLPMATVGQNILWDFTGLSAMFPVIFDSIKAPAALPSSSLYPGASYCQKRDDTQSFFSSNTTLQTTELVGIYSPSLALTFTNSALVANYPMAYGYSNVDAVSGSYKAGTATGACNGSISVSADATGTLVFAGNVTFTNVIRLRSIQQLTLSSGFLPFGTITQYIYRFFAPQIKYPVFTVQYQKYQLLAGTPTITAMAYASNNYFTVAGVENYSIEEDEITVFPNPVVDRMRISSIQTAQVYNITIYDCFGKKLKQFENSNTCDLSDLAAGVYLAELTTASGSFTKKIIKSDP